VTTLGTFLDPLADKLLIVAALIALISARGIPTWMVIVVVGEGDCGDRTPRDCSIPRDGHLCQRSRKVQDAL